MRLETIRTLRWERVVGVGLAALLISLQGCNLNKTQVPGLIGPSELALALRLTASPDVLTADGFSSSSVQAELRDQNGQPVSGRAILFALSDESGNFADIGTLETTSGNRLHAGTATATTNGSGIAQVIYRSPARTDATANQTVLVDARPVGTDANGIIYRTVRIELKSAEPRLFPQNPNNTPPNCNFVIEPGTGGAFAGNQILFQSTSNDPDGTIVRYEWDFGDGGREDKPDVIHVYAIAGTYTVTHVVTDDDGAQAACAADVTVQ